QQVECFLRCFINAHPSKWSKWLPLCEFWYNTNWHSALNKSPFEVLYGHSPRYFGISASDTVAPVDLQQWLEAREVVQQWVRQHLLRVQQRMKCQADKHRTERTFEVGDKVFLKLQPYGQSSVAHRANHKLAFKYFGPFLILEKIGEVAYRLELPAASRIHPVFHVSQLKRFVQPQYEVLDSLPCADAHLQVPIKILQEHIRRSDNRSVAQALIQWSGGDASTTTWEDKDSIRQLFPRALAWGQAGSEGEGDVSAHKDRASHPEARGDEDSTHGPAASRPTRDR
uniref:Tf2-1-like SH3-like domain-containing protein n=1 Tax=Aegilops tauschii subsp. strangulata TaxID=200361 RepID=A0A453C2C0_AEGTS